MTIKKIAIVCACLFMFTSCLEQELVLNINKNGKANLKYSVIVEDTYAGEEAQIAVWGMVNSFPELKDNYTIEKKAIDDGGYFNNKTAYEFSNNDLVDLKSNQNIDFYEKDGVYWFEMKIPSLEIDNDDDDEVIYSLTITLPKEIEMATTSRFSSNRATWKIHKSDLKTGMVLKAFTVK
ncbi:hypothetical protein [Psychroserpens jangbogonensis]|uniref:hypothetical protein n=1 Tax=Psychroserpens jangbogonensis TaxID=1484460 RepID=UPI000B0D24BB|nr:hypothetical protein [Psychroserpens jangbogonensis]